MEIDDRNLQATNREQRNAWRILPFGSSLEWEELDEHISIEGLQRGRV